ncbi:MAG: DUF86 domain-containing protein [Desulfobulbaceae bacterium]|nr:DUF86 domain-containing protein [Desulfobulbaceae bacterium]
MMEVSDRDRQIILSILNYIDGISRTHINFKNEKEVFLENTDYQFSIAFAILQIGELVSSLESPIKNKLKIKGLRNRIVHGYGSIDKAFLWDISHNSIKELRNELETLGNI